MTPPARPVPPISRLLLPGRTWIAGIVLALGGAGAVAFLGRRYAHQVDAGHLDNALDTRVINRLAGHHGLLQHLVDLANPHEAAVISGVLLLLCLAARRWEGAALVAIAIPASAATTEWLLKPRFGRLHGGGLAYPSGHTTGAFAIAVVVTILLVGARWPAGPIRALVALGFLGIAGSIAISLVALGYHYSTDTIGGACTALTVDLLVALAIDLVPRRSGRPSTQKVPAAQR